MASPPLLVVGPLLLFLFLSCLPHGTPDLAADSAALLAFSAAVGHSAIRWNSSTSACTWQGVICESGRVVVLRLPGVGILGQIPAGTIGNLSALRTLSLRFNALSGSLPKDLGNCVELRNLYLQGNRFTGEIPASLFSLRNLVRLNLAGNNFTGGVPLEFNKLTRLATLYLQDNSLSGEIPNLDLPSLAQFNVSSNQLNGSIPSGLRKMPKSSFLNTGLCGGPLEPCAGEPSPSPAESPSGTAGGSGGVMSKKKKLSGGAIAGIAIGSAVGVLILLALLILLCRRSGGGRKTRSLDAAAVAKPPETAAYAADGRDRGLPEGGSASTTAAPPAVAAAAAKGDAKKLIFFGKGSAPFDLEDLLRASAEVLGKGTFGTAYKALLEMGTTVAVKRLKDVNLPEREFREKIEAVGALEHENLVPLRAYYFSKDEKLLVYDYMATGSLSALLHGNRGSGRTPLNWETRSNIALAAARGIEYIHSTNSLASHGNIKSSNILLTKSYEARVSDHGLANLVGSISSTTRVAGYRAPEVTDPRRVSQKADVYSFGVLLLELLTGKAPTQALLNDEGVDLPRWVQSIVKEEWTAEVFDMELLRYQNVEEEMVELLQLAIDCSAQYPDKRPSMSEVVARIEKIRSSPRPANEEQQNTSQSIEDGDDRSSMRTDGSVDGIKHSGAES